MNLNTVIKLSNVEVPAVRRDVSRQEFFAASTIGMRPSCVYVVHASAYNSEDRLYTHEDKCLAIYRTYQNGDYTELYCESRIGIR